MDDSWQLRACSSSRSSSQHFPLPGGSRNQMEMNFGQFSHPYVAQEVCVIERTIRQEPVAPNSASYGYSGCSTKMARPELGNSFLALLSGPSQPFRSEYQQSSSIRSAVLAGNSPFYQINALENGSWPPLAAADVSSVSQISGNGGFGNGLELSHIGTSRESLPTGYNRVTTFPDNFDPVNVRSHVSDILKQGIRSTVNDSEAELHTSVPQWLTEAANLRQQQLHSIQSTRLPKTLTGTRYNEVEQSLSVMKARPRVFCVGTNGMMSGELVLSDTGRLGVLCSCHNHHMSVAKFSEHAGQASCNPGSAVHMENGETLVMWRKAFFFQFGVKVPDDEKGWDWNDGNSSETGAVKCKTANTQNIEKENLLLYQMDHPTVKPRNAQFCNNPVYCNNSYEENVTQGSSGGSFFPSAAQKNMHEVREALLKNINKVCKGSMPTQMSQPLLERLKDDFSKVPDMSGSNSCRGSSNYVNNPVAEYIDFINSGGRTLITNQSPAGLKFFQKGFTLNNTSNMQEPVPQEKDSMSSSFELRLGQPSQQRHGIGGPLPDSLDSQVSSAAIDRQKSLFLQHMWQRGPSSSRSNAPSSEDQNLKSSQTKEAFCQRIGCTLPSGNDRPLLRLTRNSPKCCNNLDGELSINKQKDSNQVIISENVDHPGDIESSEFKQSFRADAHIVESRENAMSAALGTNSTIVVSVGENDSGAEKGYQEQNKIVERNDIMNTGCESFQWKQDNGKVTSEAGAVQDECPVDLTYCRETVEDHLADTAAKGSVKGVIDTGSPKKEEQMSNVCSKISDNILSEFSDAGHVINDDICNVDYGGKKLMHSDVVDEGSGIGKCCSSDAVDTGIWTRRKLASASGDKNVLVSTSLLPNPTSNGDNAVSKVRSSLRLKRLHKSTECLSADGEQALKTVGKTGKFEKKRRTMKWKRLDATALPFEDNSKKSVPLNHAKKIDFTPVPSCTMVKASDMQNITASTSSNLTKGLNLKRKRSAVVSGNPLTSNHKIQEFQEDRRKEAPVQQVHFKGDKLVIRIQKNLMERKPKQNGVDGVKFDRTSSRKVTKYDTMSSGKALAIRNNDIVFTEDKIKLSQCKSSSAVRNIRAGHGKPTLKSAKMASLSSILKHAKRHVDTPCKSGKQSSAAEVGSEALNKNVGKLGKFSISEKRQANELKTSFEYIMEANPRRDGKESNKSVNVKEVRKRSLSELSRKNNHENKSTQFSAPSTSTQSKNVCQTDPSSALGSEFSNNHCLFPRGERTLRLRFKCKNKSNFLKPNSTASTGTSNWHSANHNSFSNIYFQSDDVWRPEYCELENGAQSVAISVAKDDLDESKIEISPLEEPLCSVTKEMRKCLSSITFQKKETESIIKTIPKVSKKQKHVRNDEKVQVHVGECTEMIDVSCVPRVGCNTVKIKKRKNGEIHGEKHGRDPLQKKCRIENTALGPNFEADVRCCVCGDLNEESINRLVQCGSCLIKVHQACYGVSKIPKSGWTCRACKSNLNDIVCVLCGYGGGAMTRAQKTRNVVKSLLQVWQVTRDTNLKALPEDIRPPQNKCDAVNEFGAKSSPRISESNKAEFGASGNGSMNILSLGKQDNNKSFLRSNLEDVQLQIGSIKTGKAPNYINSEFQVHNTITAAVNNPGVTQWVHMVCGLWMPGTRCLNVATMGVFDISGATIPRKKVVCSICKRPGGLCIQCRVVKCSVPFHPWCAHQKASLQQLAHSARQEVEFSLYQEELKQTHIGFAHSYSVILATQGLLQSEREGDRGDKVGFYGRCLLHAKYSSNHSDKVKSRDNLHINTQSESDQGTCARTKGYKGRKSWEEARAELQRHSDTENTRVVTQEQINAWLHINGRKSCTRGFIKSPNTDVKSDYRREYLRFKQEQGWKRLVVYKSGIHALGLYTAQNILKGEMVVEYIGEIIGLHVADKREIAYHSRGKMQYEGACYFFRIDKENIIDATRKGGIARFVNHSCSPNCAAKVISVRTQKKVVFFAERDINAGEEITYDYHFNHEDDGMKIPCFCNSRNCRRYLN
ncbi:uncharacterized protein LOC131060909 isoform X5 [Cryptomeria japonica]|uniref:uncharacterized protein LOC131060909 isoform X5 n=1 Tax=Cryptomeria japonica TaxID=3369 RepID=UPI0027D9D50A|nr:uncharacterized protein LOC131060909 isoform X5 [Cryptomeria japonica]